MLCDLRVSSNRVTNGKTPIFDAFLRDYSETHFACVMKKICAPLRDQLHAHVKFGKDPSSGFRVLLRTKSAPSAAAALGGGGRRLKTKTNIAPIFQMDAIITTEPPWGPQNICFCSGSLCTHTHTHLIHVHVQS